VQILPTLTVQTHRPSPHPDKQNDPKHSKLFRPSIYIKLLGNPLIDPDFHDKMMRLTMAIMMMIMHYEDEAEDEYEDDDGCGDYVEDDEVDDADYGL
jgi:hypothetical protein